MSANLLDLIVEETKAAIYDFALTVADGLSLDTTTWRPGDPTRSLYWVLAEKLEAWEGVTADFIKAAFLDYATGDMLVIHAYQQFGYVADVATHASCTVRLTNGGGGQFTIDVDDLTVKDTATGKTYRNTTEGVLDPLGTLNLTFVADETGSASNAAVGEIDDLVTTLLGVTVSNTTAAVGTDAESESSIRDGCRAKLDSLSPNGAAGAYAYVATNSTLTGDTETTRVRVYGDTETNDVSVVIAGASGAIVGAGVVALVQAAILEWCTPLTTTAVVVSATNVPIAVTYTIYIYQRVSQTDTEVKATIAADLLEAFTSRPIGGDIISPASGKIYASFIESVIRSAYPDDTFHVVMSAPAVDTALTTTQVATLGTVTGTVTFVSNP